MAIRLDVTVKFKDWKREAVLGSLKPKEAFQRVFSLSRFKGFEYAKVSPTVDGQTVTDGIFQVTEHSEVRRQFTPWYVEGL